MILPARCYHLLARAVTLWEECGENPAIFCYLITWGTFATLRSRTLALIPNFARHQKACSILSSIFSTRSTPLAGSGN